MSAVERNKGKLIPVDTSTLTKDQCVEPWDYGMMEIRTKFYKVEFEIKGDDYCDFAEVTENKDGSIDFHTMHYNGGAGLEEVIESGMK